MFTDIGLLRCSRPWIIKEILSFWFQMESILGLPVAHWGFPCTQQASCSPLWPPSAESQLSVLGSEVPTPHCLLLVTCFINLHLSLICQFDLTSEPCPRDYTSLSLWAWPSLQKLYFSGSDEAGPQSAFTCPAIIFYLYVWSDPSSAVLGPEWLLQTNWRPVNTFNFSNVWVQSGGHPWKNM